MEIQLDQLKAALASARSHLSVNDPQGALSSVTEAVRLLGVPEELFPALKEARRHSALLQQGQAPFQISVEDLVSTLSQVSICAQQSVSDSFRNKAQRSQAAYPSELVMEASGMDFDTHPIMGVDDIPSTSTPVPVDPWVLAALHHRQLHLNSVVQLHDDHRMELDNVHCSQSRNTSQGSIPIASRLEPDIAKKAFHVTCRDDLTACALRDGSSYVCPQCQGVVQTSRRSQHMQFWCQPQQGPG
ncbi:hypothetical protein CEUSTIGMA_g2618.t1 [Chlamydomonas eustigma]|uniref:C2HC zinc finger plants domain-containing protein n=1 Tax=Chlamydomonas eustigma TaxID=1157962 RepID=A0A250WWG7_9CHLO|nr:hypothetical protein CEUSTIGMA_g2618.t1 [Chlamydomonas eustigma]|eukprot:GAX75174.1 hypothetical protein CEUSTIGMA_g2618.t1 [Chlamydomonas eustigma]